MLKNLEIKYHCSDFAPIREALKEIGAHCIKIADQEDYYFNISTEESDAKLKYRIEEASRTLVYYSRPPFQDGKGAQCDFTLNGLTKRYHLVYLR